jgi:hypothetical protein
MIRSKFSFFWAVLAVIGMTGLAPPAWADFELRYSTNGGATFTTITGTVGTPIVATVDGLNVIASTTSSISTGLSTIDLNVNGTATSPNIVVQATMTSVTTAPPPQVLTFAYTGSLIGAVTGVTFTMQTWVDNANADFGIPGTFSPGAKNVPSSGSATFNGVVPYSVTVGTNLSYTGLATISSDNNDAITPAPAPAGLLLLVSGAPALALAWLRRRKTKDQQS